jgi:hypothetical protein
MEPNGGYGSGPDTSLGRCRARRISYLDIDITAAVSTRPAPGGAANPAGSLRADAGLQTSTAGARSEEIDLGDVVRYPSQNQ